MRSLYIIIALLPIFGPCLANAIACNCEYCDEEKVIGLGEETTTHHHHTVMYEEDSDNDGNRTICARTHDFKNRTFPSICYMSCYNHCTKYRIAAIQENNVTKYAIVASRPNYYKLKDGVC